MEESAGDYSKILEMKMRWQLREATDESILRSMQQYISQMQMEEEGHQQEAFEGGIQSLYQNIYQRIQTAPEAPGEKGKGTTDSRTARAAYEAYRQILEEKEKPDKENAVSFDRKG